MIEIQVNNLVKSFEVGHNVLDGVTFQIDQGQRVGLLGKNGAERVLELPLTAEELANFHKCCDDVRKNIKTAEGIAAAECK